MPDSDSINSAIATATHEVFETMLGVTLEVTSEVAADDEAPGVVALIGLTGTWAGSGTISCSPVAANLVARRMLMLESESSATIDDDTLDAVAELTNMVIGNVKHLLADEFGDMAISIPTVVYGRNFRFKKLTGMTQGCVTFRFEDCYFEVKVALAQSSDAGRVHHNRLSAPLMAC